MLHAASREVIVFNILHAVSVHLDDAAGAAFKQLEQCVKLGGAPQPSAVAEILKIRD